MDKKINTLLGTAIVPKVIDLIMTNDGESDIKAVEKFYTSKTYEALSDAETDVWHLSPLTIYNMWKHEVETGELVFPEEL
jgi:hypothetical protein